MKAAMFHGPGDIRVDEVTDPRVETPTDAVVRVVAAAVCGTDLRGYCGLPGPVQGPRCGHEFVGVVVDIGREVTTVRPGDVVVAPFMFADGVCRQCVRGLPSSCSAGGMWGGHSDGGQAEAVRVPFADATLIPLPTDEHDERLPAILTLADVMSTGWYGAQAAGVSGGETVVVVGDGAVGLCSVLAARHAGAERILLVSTHESRHPIATRFGATDIVAARGRQAIDRIRELTDDSGVDIAMECVGEPVALQTATEVCSDGGTLGLLGGPHFGIDTAACFLRNLTLTGGLAPVRRYIPSLLDKVLAGDLDASPVFDHTVTLADIDTGYQAMRDRRATKVLVRP
ncbi:zinc-binding dehydrogenase [Nocardia alni]|uniref:zinc-binding dehydrogenase n=1 Tax=Nocardia alni TaxID=2815723 RepID=UPI001C24FB81|nr:alcohol dehydrogenase catalytic domain-containing protein [Nocardia alni]